MSPGIADHLPPDDGSVDAAVASLVLCSVPDQHRARAELHRVLRPGGNLRFSEHVIPRGQPKRLLLQAVDHSGLWPKIASGCHPARDTTAALEHAGFQIETSERLMFAASRLEPAIPTSSASHDDADNERTFTGQHELSGIALTWAAAYR